MPAKVLARVSGIPEHSVFAALARLAAARAEHLSSIALVMSQLGS